MHESSVAVDEVNAVPSRFMVRAQRVCPGSRPKVMFWDHAMRLDGQLLHFVDGDGVRKPIDLRRKTVFTPPTLLRFVYEKTVSAKWRSKKNVEKQ